MFDEQAELILFFLVFVWHGLEKEASAAIEYCAVFVMSIYPLSA